MSFKKKTVREMNLFTLSLLLSLSLPSFLCHFLLLFFYQQILQESASSLQSSLNEKDTRLSHLNSELLKIRSSLADVEKRRQELEELIDEQNANLTSKDQLVRRKRRERWGQSEGGWEEGIQGNFDYDEVLVHEREGVREGGREILSFISVVHIHVHMY